MNESGRAVQEAANFFKLAVSDITVFQDELELPPAKVRVKIGGGIAGHNGLRSISSHIGNDYRRVRLGIGLRRGDRVRILDGPLAGLVGILDRPATTPMERVCVLLDVFNRATRVDLPAQAICGARA